MSAWNDNGKVGFIEQKPELLYRTDFFPGKIFIFKFEPWLTMLKLLIYGSDFPFKAKYTGVGLKFEVESS